MEDFTSYFNFPPSNPPEFDEQGRLHICIDVETINVDFANEQNEQGRERLKRNFLSMLDYARTHPLLNDDFGVKMNSLTSLLDSISVSPFQKPLPEPTADRTLLNIISNIIDNELFATLGPESQRPGPATEDCRFVCIFCHEVKKRTGDVRVHLHKKHGCDWEDIKKVFHKKTPRGLRVFGQYSYEDVQRNKWRIADWRGRKPRSLRPVEVTSEVSTSSKRKSRDSSREGSEHHRTPVPWTSFQPRDRVMSSENLPQLFPFTGENDLSFAGTTLSPTSPFPQTMADYQHSNSLPQICVDQVPEADEMFQSLGSSGASEADLVQIGASTHFADNLFSMSKPVAGDDISLASSLLDNGRMQDIAFPLPSTMPSSNSTQSKRPHTKVALPRGVEYYQQHR